MNNEQVFQEAKPKKKWYKKWWVWAIAVVIVIIAANGGYETQPTPTQTTPASTKQEDTKPPEKTQSEEAKAPPQQQNTGKTNAANDVLKLYEALQENEAFPYTMGQKATEFLKANPTLFPATSVDAVTPLTDSTVEFKHLNKSISNYGDKLISIQEGYVAQIEEENIEGKVLTSVHVVDSNENSYQIIYIGSLADVFEEDNVSVYGLPLGMSSFDNVSGGTTIVAVLAGSYIQKI